MLYAESAGHLPMSNHTYAGAASHASQSAQRGAGCRRSAATTFWRDIGALVDAMRTGQSAWGVPAYNGALFARTDSTAPRFSRRLRSRTPSLPPRSLRSLAILTTLIQGRLLGLEIGHLGHIYEASSPCVCLLPTMISATTRKKIATCRRVARSRDRSRRSAVADQRGRTQGGACTTPALSSCAISCAKPSDQPLSSTLRGARDRHA